MEKEIQLLRKKDNVTVMSQNFGGGSVMVWEAFGYKKKSEIVFLNGRQNAAMFQDVFVPWAKVLSRTTPLETGPGLDSRFLNCWLDALPSSYLELQQNLRPNVIYSPLLHLSHHLISSGKYTHTWNGYTPTCLLSDLMEKEYTYGEWY
uniref:Uncharacterized protein n=1 Tax=Strigamia maritima TaxID=126957 RepID=T1IZ52_STRMM